MNKYAIAVVIIFLFSGTTSGIAQEQLSIETNSISSNRQSVASHMGTNDSPIIGISNDDFWKIFGPLIEQSFNTSSVSTSN